ncbi:MAG: aminopeptidase C [Deltaproteobacteria bacterium]
MNKDITFDQLKVFKEKYRSKPNNKLMESIITTNGIINVARNKDAINRNKNVFSIELPRVKISDQEKSRRCWAFAGLNLLKRQVAQSLNIDIETFELSQNYIVFYDKLEKANNFYESIIKFREKELLDREMLVVLDWALYEGGHWQYFTELVKKYGVVPKAAMPETKDSKDSAVLTEILNTKVARDAIKLKRMLKELQDLERIREEKNKMLEQVYNILCKVLGEPPEKFEFEFYDKNNSYKRIDFVTPLDFYAQNVKIKIDDYIVVANVPMHNKQYNKIYKEREYIADIIEKSNHYFFNIELNEMKELVVKTLKDGEPVYFDTHFHKNNDAELEIFDAELYQFDKVLEVDLEMSKEELLDYREIRLQHMMLFTGVHIVDDKILRWKVENSFGSQKRNEGYYVMNDNFFNKYVLECVINKKYFTEEQLKFIEKEPIMFEPWEPMS